MRQISQTIGQAYNRLIINGKAEYYYTVDNLPSLDIYELPIVRKGGKNRKQYYNIACAFDIETTNIKSEKPYAFMYHWQFCFNNKTVIFGRTWQEYRKFVNYLANKLELSESKRLVVYVHNLGFEFQFLYSQLPEIKEVFAREKRKIIKFFSQGIEYRCSYMLSNMSLAKFCENSKNCSHYKLTGTYDYTKIRYPWTELTPHELKYCYNDVKGLAECIQSKLDEDNIATIPLTSTGYVRRDFRKAMFSNEKNKRLLKSIAVDSKIYELLKEAFRGGNTHANALYTGLIMKDVYSNDLASSYPAAMLIDKYPMTAFINANPLKFYRYLDEGKAMLFRMRIENVYFTATHGIPYIPISKCRNLKNVTNDNGRVLMCDSLEITVTDIDYKIILKDYDFENLQVSNLYIADYGFLPNEYRKEIYEYFKQKTQLKGIKEKEYEYMKSKNKINASYGMIVTDILNDEITFINGEWGRVPVNPEEAIEKHNNAKSTFLAYQWGIWVTANARKRLEDMLHIVGDSVLYVDTDSIKYIGNFDNAFKAKNAEIIELSNNAEIETCVVKDGKKHYMGIWDFDGHYQYFKTLGAKKYIYVKDGKTTLTVAGLSKHLASTYIKYMSKRNKCNPCELFEKGALFARSSGRTTAFYNDVSRETLTAENRTFESGSNVAIMETTYVLGITGEYENLLKEIQKNS